MPTTFIPSMQEGLQNRESGILIDQSRTQREHIGIVVSACPFRHLNIRGNGAANMHMPIGADGHANTGAADQHAKLVRMQQQMSAQPVGIDRIVHSFAMIWPEIMPNVGVIRLFNIDDLYQASHEGVAQIHACVIRSKYDQKSTSQLSGG